MHNKNGVQWGACTLEHRETLRSMFRFAEIEIYSRCSTPEEFLSGTMLITLAVRVLASQKGKGEIGCRAIVSCFLWRASQKATDSCRGHTRLLIVLCCNLALATSFALEVSCMPSRLSPDHTDTECRIQVGVSSYVFLARTMIWCPPSKCFVL